MLRHTNGFVGLLLQTLMVIPSGLAWAQTTSGAACSLPGTMPRRGATVTLPNQK